MAQTILTPDLDTITGDIEIAAPPERVFRALTDERQLFQWWGKDAECKGHWHMDARKGGKWRFQGREGKIAVNEIAHEATGEILEYDPPRLLVYSWVANWHDRQDEPTVVRWELTPIQTGTRVKVTHRGLAQQPASREGYSGGWRGVLRLLKTHCER